MADDGDYYSGSRPGGYTGGFSMPLSPFIPPGRRMHGERKVEEMVANNDGSKVYLSIQVDKSNLSVGSSANFVVFGGSIGPITSDGRSNAFWSNKPMTVYEQNMDVLAHNCFDVRQYGRSSRTCDASRSRFSNDTGSDMHSV